MKRIASILAIGIAFAAMLTSPTETKAQGNPTAVNQPFPMVDSTMYALKPYYNSVSQGYMQLDSAYYANGYSIITGQYPVWDTVRFARQRSLLIQVNNTAPIGSFEL